MLKRVARALLSNALFWIFLILGSMVLFIVCYERPINFAVQNDYHIF